MTRPLIECISINSQRVCKVPGCSRLRHRISGYCLGHTSTNTRWGSPRHSSRGLKRYELKVEREECREIIDYNLDVTASHPGLTKAVKLMSDWLMFSSKGVQRMPQWRHMSRLCLDGGVTGRDILVEASAIWLVWDRRPHLIHSLKHYQMVTGNAVARMAPLPKGRTVVPPRVKKEIGAYLHKSIGIQVVSVVRAVAKREKARNKKIDIMNQPLEVDFD